MSNSYEVEKYQAILVRDEQGNLIERDYAIDHQRKIIRMRDDLTDEQVFDVGYEFGRQERQQREMFGGFPLVELDDDSAMDADQEPME